MQRPNEAKRQQIVAAAARLFAARPFHKVKLDDVAASAAVGKGTLYVYFSSKEDLYASLVYEAFARLIVRLRELVAGDALSPRESLRTIIAELFRFAFQHPEFFDLMRTVPQIAPPGNVRWNRKRRELSQLIEAAINRGVHSGQFRDPRPDLTALCIPGFVRSLMLFGPKNLKEQEAVHHAVQLIESGIVGRMKVSQGRLRRRA